MSPLQPLDELEMSAWRSMLRAHACVVRRLEAELVAAHGLSVAAYEVLAHLSGVPGRSLRMADLSEAALLSPSGVTRLVDKLQREGLVRRRRCDADARVIYCELTDAGLGRLVTAYPTHLQGVREHLVDKLDRGELRRVAAAMAKVAEPAACRDRAPEAAECEASYLPV